MSRFARGLALLLCAVLADAAEPAPLTPLLDHLVAPRSAIDLGGTWEWSLGPLASTAPTAGPWQPVTVPGNHAALFKAAGSTQQVWFRRRFEIPAALAQQAVDIHAERIADICRVVLNGVLLGEHAEGWSPFRLACGSALHAGSNELLIGVASATAAGAVGHRAVGFTWLYGEFSGIPHPVHLETHAPLWIEDVFVMPRLGPGTPHLVTVATLRNDGAQPRTVTLSAHVGTEFQHRPQSVTLAAGTTQEVRLDDPWAAPHLWWPHDPFLQYLAVDLQEGTTLIDACQQRFGFRELRVDGASLLLNDRPLLQRRSSLLVYASHADGSTLEHRVAVLRPRGFNGDRLHGGFALRLVRRADELGWLIAPEAALVVQHSPDLDAAFWPAAAEHLTGMVRSLRNSPSVIYWCLSNEFGSFYNPPDARIQPGKLTGRQIDAWLAGQIERIAQLDPSRLATCSGDVDLGGNRGHGPAPALSYHYAWQPWKLGNQLPLTADWLLRGLTPWQGVAWDQRKPVFLSEDLFEPYCFKAPHGLSQWAGDQAYDPATRAAATLRAYQWLAAGNYRAGVSVWNPWGTNEADEKPHAVPTLYDLGQPMPDYLVAFRGWERTWRSGGTLQRTVDVHHRLFRDLSEVTVRWEIAVGGHSVSTEQRLALPAGSSRTLELTLDLPAVAAPLAARTTLTLEAEGKALARTIESWVLFPPTDPVLPPRIAWLGPDAPPSVAVVSDLAAALALQPAALVLNRSAQPAAAGRTLEPAVRDGLHVLWLETPAAAWLPEPLRVDPHHDTAHAFVRAPADPLLAGISDDWLSCWRPAGMTAVGAVGKPERGAWQVLCDVGGPAGMTHAALLRQDVGRGRITVCQLPLASAAHAGEPAAAELLARLLAPLPATPVERHVLALIADAASPVPAALTAAGVRSTPWLAGSATPPALLLIDAATATAPALSAARTTLASGGTVVLHRLSPAAAGFFAAGLGATFSVQPERAKQARRTDSDALSDGLSADDLWWDSGKNASPLLHGSITAPAARMLLNPAGLAVLRVGPGQLVLDEVRWSEARGEQPERAGRYIRTLITNLGGEITPAAIVRQVPVALAAAANGALGGDGGRSGWPGPGDDDLRFFPVNRSGMDPRNGMAAPREPFTPQVQLGGVPFTLIDHEANHGRDLLVIAPDPAQGITLPLQLRAQRLWFAGGAAVMQPDGQPVLVVTWHFADGSTEASTVIAGEHCQGVQYQVPVRTGRIGWSGLAPRHDDAVIWVWDLPCPRPGAEVQAITLCGSSTTNCGLVAITADLGGDS